jgi:hypothetical protein
MENAEAQSTRRSRSKERGSKEGPAYQKVAEKAVYKEADFKAENGPSVSMTVVGETVSFEQHFHF